MTGTNVDYYAAGFDKDGKRVCSLICDFNPDKEKNTGKKAELLDKVKATSKDVAIAEIITADDFIQYLNGHVRDTNTGKPVEYVPPEPTAEEIATSKQAALEAEYTSAQQELGQSLLVANLNGDTDTAAGIQSEYSDLNAYYKEQSDAITAELTAATEGSDK
jgi:hypothetical protein